MRHPLAALFLLAAATIPATAAQAATLAADPAKPCYLTGETFTLRGSGFTPGASVPLTQDGNPLGSLTADGAGSVLGRYTVGFRRGYRARNHHLVATDAANPALTATFGFHAANRAVRMPARFRPGRRMRIRASGFLTGRRLYAHVRGRRHKSTRRLGRPTGPCGTLTTRKRLFRRGTPPGRYVVQFDTKRRYKRRTAEKTRHRVVIYRTYSRQSSLRRSGRS